MENLPATWNVGRIFEEEVLKRLNDEFKKYKFDVVVMQELSN